MSSTADNIVDMMRAGTMNIASESLNPEHYNNHPLGIECKDVIKCEPYYISSAIRYIVRRHDKGDYRLNLEKAIQCLRFQIADPFCDMIRYHYSKHPSGIDIENYVKHMEGSARAALQAIFSRHDTSAEHNYEATLEFAILMIQQLAEREKGITLL